MSGLVEALEASRARVDQLEQEKVHALRRFGELAEELKAKKAYTAWLEAKVKDLEAKAKK